MLPALHFEGCFREQQVYKIPDGVIKSPCAKGTFLLTRLVVNVTATLYD